MSSDMRGLTRLEGRCMRELASQRRKVLVSWGSASVHRWAVNRKRRISNGPQWLYTKQATCALLYLPARGELWSCHFLLGGESPQSSAAPPGWLETASRRCCANETNWSDWGSQSNRLISFWVDFFTSNLSQIPTPIFLSLELTLLWNHSFIPS